MSARAYRAIKATLPAGSTVYPPERNAKGQYLLWLAEVEPGGGAARRWELYSDAGHSAREGGKCETN